MVTSLFPWYVIPSYLIVDRVDTVSVATNTVSNLIVSYLIAGGGEREAGGARREFGEGVGRGEEEKEARVYQDGRAASCEEVL